MIMMVRRDRRRDVRARGLDEGHRLGRGDMLEDDPELRKVAGEAAQNAVDIDGFAIEDVDLRVRDFAMDQQRHADPLHRLQRRRKRGDVGHAMRRIGRGIGGIEFAGGEHARFEPARDLAGIGMIDQIAGHQRLEGASCGQGGEDAPAIVLRRIDHGHRRNRDSA